MSQVQKGVCAEPNLHALYLTFTVVDDDVQAMRLKLVRILELFSHYDEEYYEAMVTGVVAIGTEYWYELYPRLIPNELAPFPAMQCDGRQAPMTPGDVLIQIKADRLDICHEMGLEVIQLLGPHVDLYEQVTGFRYLDGRDLTGFMDASNNPRGMRKYDIAIVGDEDPEFAGGSYIHIQRYRHNMTKWQLLAQPHQEQVMGRTKAANKELAEDKKAPFSHASRTQIKDSQGNPVEVLQQSMPYGDMKVQGLFFISCARSPEAFRQLLTSRVIGDEKGHYDKLLDYTFAETGSAYFAPSVDFIKHYAR
jgi:putative iron-dependent peroxidase